MRGKGKRENPLAIVIIMGYNTAIHSTYGNYYMLKDFAKLMTFLTVVREKSFSKASAKLGISQPAVTQQIKFIEDYLDTRIVERKKNGIKLTKEGEDLYRIAIKLEKAIQTSEKEVLKIINKEFTFVVGASYAIGTTYPSYLGQLKEKINNEVHIRVAFSDEIIEQLLDKKIDIALIESPVFRDGLIYREWEEDELVIFQTSRFPNSSAKKTCTSSTGSAATKIRIPANSLRKYSKRSASSVRVSASSASSPVRPRSKRRSCARPKRHPSRGFSHLPSRNRR